MIKILIIPYNQKNVFCMSAGHTQFYAGHIWPTGPQLDYAGQNGTQFIVHGQGSITPYSCVLIQQRCHTTRDTSGLSQHSFWKVSDIFFFFYSLCQTAKLPILVQIYSLEHQLWTYLFQSSLCDQHVICHLHPWCDRRRHKGERKL